MFRQLLNWRVLLAVIAILIVIATIFYSSYVAKKIEKEERQKVEEWVEASTSLLSANTGDTRLHLTIIQNNDDIPIIVTNEKDSILDHKNLDSAKIANDPNYLRNRYNNSNLIMHPLSGQILLIPPLSINIIMAIAGC
jgi:heme/copper-type cytochrome/quinol oxidase subunit 1